MIMKTFGVRLSQEELALLIDMVGEGAMIGVDAHFPRFVGASSGEVMAVQRALYARGVLIPGQDKSLVLDSHVRRILQVCLRPQYRVTLIGRRPNWEVPQYETYYQVSGVTVRHKQESPGIHDLMVFLEQPDYVSLLTQRIGKINEARSVSFDITYAHYLEIEQGISVEDCELSTEKAASMGILHEQALALCQALAHFELKLFIEVGSVQSTSVNTMALICAPGQCWMVDGLDDGKRATIYLERLNANQLSTQLDVLFFTKDTSDIG